MKKKHTEEPRIVAAVGIATHSETAGLADALEQAQSQAVTAALAEGISIADSEAIRQRMAAARDRVLAEFGR